MYAVLSMIHDANSRFVPVYL